MLNRAASPARRGPKADRRGPCTCPSTIHPSIHPILSIVTGCRRRPQKLIHPSYPIPLIDLHRTTQTARWPPHSRSAVWILSDATETPPSFARNGNAPYLRLRGRGLACQLLQEDGAFWRYRDHRDLRGEGARERTRLIGASGSGRMTDCGDAPDRAFCH